MKRMIAWLAGTIGIGAVLYVIFYHPLPVLFFPELPHLSFFGRCFYILLLAASLCLIRVALGPTAADRIVAIDILGILIVGFCAIVNIPTGRGWYMDIAIAWALQSFIATLALAKYLEGKNLDD
ncbi:MAG: cation:proton antiporter [Chitinispirillaceae bacterium]|nr:cation:proton antiporter [Chitinispirillaceae bacterium]